MKKLFAPWRMPYAKSKDASKQEDTKEAECIFCAVVTSKPDRDTQELVLKRDTQSYVLLNRYPYNAGHLLIVPNRHVKSLDQLTQHERAELMELISKAAAIVKQALNCDGVNIGMNVGSASGAGIPSHLHVHVLPRWEGDTNFLPTIGQTKVISFDMGEIYERLQQAFMESTGLSNQ